MDITVSFQNRLVIFDFFPDDEDLKLFNNSIHLHNRSCFFELPIEISEADIHPDILALSIILCIYPFTAKEIKLPFSVSEKFSKVVEKNLKKKLSNIDKQIKKRIVDNGRPGLAYSGGVDSTAALALMPKDIVVCFLNRTIPSFRKNIYDKTAALYALKDVSAQGYENYDIPSNMEYLRSKVGFPIDSLNNDMPIPAGIPLLLMSDKLNIDAIAFGVVMESVFWIGHEHYKNFYEDEYYKKWNPLFNSVNCNLFFPTAGLSEVATSIINSEFSISNFSRSCMRGDENSPCKKCIKCFRKTTLDKAILRESIGLDELIYNLNSREVLSNIYSQINQHENVYRYIVNNISENDLISKLKKRINIESEDTTWMERWYPRSIDLVPLKYQDEYIANIEKYIEKMSDKDIKFVENWNIDNYNTNDYESVHNWQNYIDTLITDKKLIDFLKDFNGNKIIIKFNDWLKVTV